jgi:hypothetical protein
MVRREEEDVVLEGGQPLSRQERPVGVRFLRRADGPSGKHVIILPGHVA